MSKSFLLHEKNMTIKRYDVVERSEHGFIVIELLDGIYYAGHDGNGCLATNDVGYASRIVNEDAANMLVDDLKRNYNKYGLHNDKEKRIYSYDEYGKKIKYAAHSE